MITKAPVDVFYLVKEGDLFHFRVTVTERQAALSRQREYISVTGYVDEVTGWEGEDDSPVDFERYLAFLIKWDGCAHIDFGDSDSPGYLHLCDEPSFRRHSQLMTDLFAWAKKELPIS